MLEIIVPATSANLGPGFDCLGIALDLYNKFYIKEIDKGLIIEGCSEKYKGRDNLIYKAMCKCFKKTSYKAKGIYIKIESDIPLERGLGSSASCIVAGVLAANKISGNKLSKKEMLNLATEIEGHPDNITPAFFGNMTVSIYENNEVFFNRLNLSKEIYFCALIPDFSLSTKKAREVLPAEVSYKDAIFNIGRVAMLVSALSNSNLEVLNFACKDRMHELYRGKLIKNFNEIIEECEKLDSLGTFLSGAGPTIMVILRKNNEKFLMDIQKKLASLENTWKVKKLEVNCNGAILNVI